MKSCLGTIAVAIALFALFGLALLGWLLKHPAVPIVLIALWVLANWRPQGERP